MSLLLLLLLQPNPTELPWRTKSYTHIAEGEPLAQLMRDFLSDQGLVSVISETIDGSVSGQFKAWSPNRFFKHMIAANSLIWYYEGNILYLYSSDEMISRLFTLDHLSPVRLETLLKEAHLLDSRYPLRALQGEGIVLLSGPPRYVELVSETAQVLDANAGHRAAIEGARDAIRVFPLKYAWAGDQVINQQNRQLVIPGVVSVLQSLVTGAPVTIEAEPDATVPKLRGQGLAPKTETEPQPQPANLFASDGPLLQAELRLNAVIVRDRLANMPRYEALIRELDRKPGLVEISASIIDVSSDFSQELGIDWRWEKEGELGGGFEADDDLVPGQHPYPGGDGLRLTTIIQDTTDFFMARINALEEEGKAELLSQPRVLTLDNNEARLEHGSSFFVRVAGDREVDLFNVQSGVVLNVTPHLIEENGKRRIKLSIHIEDGNATGNSVDGIPVITRSTITTQAIIDEGDSLLVGGYLQETNNRANRGVPGLMRIPILKWLFNHRKDSKRRVERMFLIKPTVVSAEASHE